MRKKISMNNCQISFEERMWVEPSSGSADDRIGLTRSPVIHDRWKISDQPFKGESSSFSQRNSAWWRKKTSAICIIPCVSYISQKWRNYLDGDRKFDCTVFKYLNILDSKQEEGVNHIFLLLAFLERWILRDIRSGRKGFRSNNVTLAGKWEGKIRFQSEK